MNSLLVWLKLLRIPNHATAVADVLAGFLIVSQWHALAWPPAALVWAIAAGLCLYAAGMVLNDLYDLELDRVERPERPLPRGQISPQAASTVGHGLLGAGVACGFLTALCAGLAGPAGVACLLAAAVWLYDRHAKKTPFGPLVMGSCRSLNWLLGMTAAGGPTAAFQWLLPLGMGLYVAGITLYARDEAGRSRRGMLIAACAVMLLGCGLAGLGIQQMSLAGQGIDLVGAARFLVAVVGIFGAFYFLAGSSGNCLSREWTRAGGGGECDHVADHARCGARAGRLRPGVGDRGAAAVDSVLCRPPARFRHLT